MVQDAGGVPKTDRTKFWKRLRDDWNRQYPNERYMSWEGFYKAYKGVAQKFKK